jgi:hypothetical protein
MTSLVAIVANAHRNPSIEFEVAHEVNGEWYTNSGAQVWPFWTIDFVQTSLYNDDLSSNLPKTIPPGWIEHLHAEAARYAANRPSSKEDRASGTSLLASLGLPTKVHSSVSGKLTRRI